MSGDIFESQRYSSAAQEASAIVKAAKGGLIGFFMHNGNVAQRFLQVFDSATLPADGAVPVFSFPVAPSAVFIPTMPGISMPFQKGIVVCTSTTFLTKTIGTADALFTVIFH